MMKNVLYVSIKIDCLLQIKARFYFFSSILAKKYQKESISDILYIQENIKSLCYEYSILVIIGSL